MTGEFTQHPEPSHEIFPFTLKRTAFLSFFGANLDIKGLRSDTPLTVCAQNIHKALPIYLI